MQYFVVYDSIDCLSIQSMLASVLSNSCLVLSCLLTVYCIVFAVFVFLCVLSFYIDRSVLKINSEKHQQQSLSCITAIITDVIPQCQSNQL